MDEPTAPLPCHDTRDARRVPSWLIWTLLLTAGVGLRLWVIARSEVAARDSVGFVRYALRLEREPLTKVLREGEQPPGYPAAVLALSWPVRAWRGDVSPETMVLSCQLASALMAALSIVPTVLLGRELAGRTVGWLAAAFFLCLPVWLRLTSDGVTEGTFLCFLATGLWLGVRALRKPSALTFAGCGLATGAAYLTRPEGLEIVLAVGAVLVGRQLFTAARQPWRRVAVHAAALVFGVAVLLGPYVGIIGRLSNKNTTTAILGTADNPDGLLPQYGVSSTGSSLLLADWMHESSWLTGGGTAAARWAWAARAVARETAQGLLYVGLGLAVVGIFLWRPRCGLGPALALAVLAAGHALVLCRMASLSGYVSERHTLILIFTGCFPAAVALARLGRRLNGVRPAAIVGGLTLLGLVAAAPALTKPLHHNRAGHKAAGQWLAKTIGANDAVLDPFNWSEFYAGRVEPRVTTDRPGTLYVVLEINDNQHSRLPHIPAAKANAKLGKVAYHWPEKKPADEAQVVVYAVPGDRLPDPTVTKPTPEYRVGVKVASPSASARPTARGG